MILILQLETKLPDSIAFSFWMAIIHIALTSSATTLQITRSLWYAFLRTQHMLFSLVMLGPLDPSHSHGNE
jgi:hypothetical protein